MATRSPQLGVPVLHGLWTNHIVRAQHTSALALGEQVLQLGAATNDDGLLLQGNMEVGWSHFFLGELEQAREHLERVLALYDHERHSSHAFTYGDNPATSARNTLAQVLWLLGYPDQALRCSEENLAILRSLVEHPYSVAFGLTLAAFLRQYLGDAAGDPRPGRGGRGALGGARPGVHGRDGLHVRGLGAHPRGRARRGNGPDAPRARRPARHRRRAGQAVLAVACSPRRACGRAPPARGWRLLDDADAAVEHTHERYWEAEIHRLRGRLLLATAEPAAPASAEACYRRALEVARRQGARSLELRAAVSLSRLWQAADRHDEARELLAPIYELVHRRPGPSRPARGGRAPGRALVPP